MYICERDWNILINTHTEENQCNGIHYSIQMMSRQPMEAHFESIERTIFCNTFHFMYMHDPQIE